MTTKILKAALTEARVALESTTRARETLTRTVPRLESFMSKHASQGLSLRADEVQVCTTGPNCCKRGSIELMGELAGRVEAKKLPLTVVPSRCMGRCSQGPNVQVGTVVYTRMNSEKLTELLDSLVNAQQLSIKLLADSEYVGEAISCEEKRCRLLLELTGLQTCLSQLTASLTKTHANLPEQREKRTLAEVDILAAIALEADIVKEIAAAREAATSIIPLNEFVTITLARRLAERLADSKKLTPAKS